MSGALMPVANWIRSQPLLRKWAHASVRLIPDVPWTARVRELGPVRIRLRRHRWYLWSDVLADDALILGVFQRLIQQGDVVYDIGANIGLYTRVMVEWFGAGQVVAFEPMRENFELLRSNVELGRIGERVRLYQLALSDASGEEDLQIDDMTSGTAVLSSVSGGEASIGRREFGLGPKSERVRVTSLDEWVTQERLPPPAMMKIDTEGAEVKVLQGARQTLQNHRPRLAIATHSDDLAAETIDLLNQMGYFCYGLVRDPESKTGNSAWQRLMGRDAPMLANNNIVAACDEAAVRPPIAS